MTPGRAGLLGALELRDPTPTWLVQWRVGASDTDEGGTRSVWFKRTDAAQWCKVTTSLD